MKTTRFGIIALSLILAAALFAAGNVADEHKDHGAAEVPGAAVAVLMPTKGNDVHGTLVLAQQDGFVHVTGKVTGLTPGEHGFHIHEFGDLRAPDGTSAGGHFNPHGTKHGGPNDEERHPGDLGNITANAQGVAEVDTKAMGLQVHFVLGRSFVVHAGKDDLKSQPSGDAGPRVAVGVIGLAEMPKEK